MKSNCDGRGRRKMKLAIGVLAITVALALSGPGARAQASPTEAKPPADLTVRTFYLNNVTQASDANEIQTALRNLLPANIKIYLVPSQNAIVMQATPEQLMLAQRLLNDLDRPKKTYRLTYTVTEMDAGKPIGTQHFAMIVVSGQNTTLKQGSKVPIATGTYSPGSSGANAGATGLQTQFTYLDVGMNFDATLDEFVNGVRLRSNVEQSSIAEERSGVGPQDPIVRQTSLKGASFLTPGKPLMLGSVDIPGSTRHLDVEVVMEMVK